MRERSPCCSLLTTTEVPLSKDLNRPWLHQWTNVHLCLYISLKCNNEQSSNSRVAPCSQLPPYQICILSWTHLWVGGIIRPIGVQNWLVVKCWITGFSSPAGSQWHTWISRVHELRQQRIESPCVSWKVGGDCVHRTTSTRSFGDCRAVLLWWHTVCSETLSS